MTLVEYPARGPASCAGSLWRQTRRSEWARRHLDDIFVLIGGRRMYLWRAADDEVLDVLVLVSVRYLFVNGVSGER